MNVFDHIFCSDLWEHIVELENFIAASRTCCIELLCIRSTAVVTLRYFYSSPEAAVKFSSSTMCSHKSE